MHNPYEEQKKREYIATILRKIARLKRIWAKSKLVGDQVEADKCQMRMTQLQGVLDLYNPTDH